MDIERIPEWMLTEADDRQIADLLARCFSTDFGGRSYFDNRQHLRLVYRQDRIVGHMALQFRAMRLGERSVTIAGLADVATDPEFRGQGIAGRLLQAALAEANASLAEFFLLFGTAKLYQAAGFGQVRNPTVWVDMRGSITREVRRSSSRDLMVLPLRGAVWDEDATLDLLGNVF
jgi:predicted N-acetyltransferase YhbS